MSNPLTETNEITTLLMQIKKLSPFLHSILLNKPTPRLIISRKPASSSTRGDRIRNGRFRVWFRFWILVLLLLVLLLKLTSSFLFLSFLFYRCLTGSVLNTLWPASSSLDRRCFHSALRTKITPTSHRCSRTDQHSQLNRAHPHRVDMLVCRLLIFMFRITISKVWQNRVPV
jgi:hypothetical protein